ncbi:MAG: Maf family nucleotide pyrophosphatase [Crocinitomicaceae bacterium]|nr:Maf family nucleotide pyrophosphatase [Crocinitomicaceae bacterium]
MDKIKLVLASKSPRRQELIKELGFPVEIRIKEVEEIYPDDLDLYKVPEYLAKLKASPIIYSLAPNEVLVTSDTVVLLEGELLGKPKGREESISMLQRLSGKMHEVVTGVSLVSQDHSYSFSSKTNVYFSELTLVEIQQYVDQNQPFDKAGSYGIQEWIGYIGVQKIEGCYYNVMGLPLHDLYRALKSEFLN